MRRNRLILVLVFSIFNILLAEAANPDAGITAIPSPKKSFCPSTQAIIATLKNYGSNTLSSVSIGWTKNGVAQTAYHWTGSLSASGATDITLSIDSFSPGMDTLVIWTYDPNGSADSNTANDTARLRFLVNMLPGPNAGSNTTLCAQHIGISLGVKGISGHSYNWTSRPAGFTSTASNPTIYPTATATYFLTETIDSTGCSATDSVRVTVNPLPDANTGGNHSICIGDTVTLGAKAISGHYYVWKTRSGTVLANNSELKVSPAESATYFLTETIVSSGCQKTDSARVTVNSFPYVNIGSSQTICGTATIRIGVASSSGINYQWRSVPSGLSANTSYVTLTPSATHMYYLSQTNTKTGCSRTDSVLIKVYPKLTADAGGDHTICPDQSVRLGKDAVKGHSYAWTSNPVGFSSTLSDPVVKPSVSTTFYLTEKVDSSGCTATSSALITIDPIPTPHIGKAHSICTGDSVVLSTLNIKGHTYQWRSKPAGTISTSNTIKVAPLSTTIYYVNETNSTGCSASDSVGVTVNAKPDAVAGSDRTVCQGMEVVLGTAAVAGNTYAWTSVPEGFTSSQSNPKVKPENTTKYILTETNASGCTNSHAVTITVNPTPSAMFSIEKSGRTCYFRAKDPYLQFYRWTFGDAATDTSTSYVSHTYAEDRKYAVSLYTRNIFGCDNSFDTTIEIRKSGLAEEYAEAIDLSIFPNPAANSFSLSYSSGSAQAATIEIFDLAGKTRLVLIDGNKTTGRRSLVLQPKENGLNPGIYFLRVTNGEGTSTKKIVLE